jgi:hypothetical protein
VQPRSLPLVGRAAALAELEAALEDARAGRGGLVLVTGEPGIGKTRLAEELVRRSPGLAVHWAWCRAEQTAGPLRTWSTVLRAMTHAEPAVSELAEGRPALRALVAGTGSDAAPHPEASRAALAADVDEALRLVPGTTRLVVLDDLHDAGTSTLRLLADVVAGLRTTPVLVLATARDTGWDGREDLRAELLHQARRVPLHPLGSDEVAALVGTDDQDRVAELVRRTGGNPLLVTELARGEGTVSPSLQALVRARLDALPATTRDVLSAAAVLGPQLRLDVLAEVVPVPLGEVASHLVPDLVTVTNPGEARFLHELLRDAVHAGLDAVTRERWHARAGAVLDELLARGRMVTAGEVAEHLLLAGPEHRDHAVARCLDAATRADQLQAFEDATGWRTRALDVVTDPAVRAALLVARARDRRATGERERARADLLEAASLASQAQRPDLLAAAALGLGTGPGGFEVDLDDQVQLDLLEEALALLPDDALALRAMVLARLSVARTLLETVAERERTAAHAVALARDSADPVALAVALTAHCDAIAGPDHVDERLAQATEVVELARGARDADLELLGRRLRLVALLEKGDRTAAEREQKAYEQRAQQTRHPVYLWYPSLWRAMWAMAEGRYDETQALLDEAAALGTGSSNAEVLTLTARWVLAAQRGATDELEALHRHVEAVASEALWMQVSAALMSVQLGDLAQARSRFAPVADRLGELPRDSEWLPALAQAALVVEGLGGHPVAPRLFDLLAPYADLWAVEGIGAALRGPVHLSLACVAPDAATRARHLARAEEQLRSVGAVGLLPVTAPPAPTTGDASLVREGDVWALAWRGRATRVRDTKGLRDLATLLARPGQEVAALDLYGGPLEHDTGEVLDATARDAYKRRLAALQEQESLSEAEAAERAELLDQLASAYGIGGRVRRTGSSAERARSAVTARIRETVKKLEELDPELGRHLRHSVRTGTFCSYAPEQPVSWRLTP